MENTAVRQLPTQNTVQTRQITPNSAKKKGGGMFFWVCLTLAITKDIFDIVVLAIQGLSMALTATVVGSVIGIPLGFIATLLGFIVGIFVNITIGVYYLLSGKKGGLRLVLLSIGVIIDSIPIVSVLPMCTAIFLATNMIGKTGNKASGSTGKTIVGKLAKKVF